jgi:hypothetical protein
MQSFEREWFQGICVEIKISKKQACPDILEETRRLKYL